MMNSSENLLEQARTHSSILESCVARLSLLLLGYARCLATASDQPNGLLR